ncbi:MAG TPA: hypothetical protein VMW78_08205 [Anaerolineae bacterium]|nr:hypothetical protein [Anaerolineae bacterium]
MKKAKKPQKEVTLVGFVSPIEEDDTVVGIEISTDDDDYLVEPNKQGKSLFNHLDEEVEVKGIVTKDEDDNYKITVTSFEVLETEDDEIDDDNYDDEE